MKVSFIGAGPGAEDLITIRGARVLSQAALVMYAGSLVPPAVLSYCHSNAEIINTADLNLEEQVAHFQRAQEHDKNVARLHSGDPSIYGAIAEQIRQLKDLRIEYEIIPGVSSFTAAAASLNTELTKPAVSQTIILTRVSGRASAVPELESIENLGRSQSTMCIFLSGPHLKQIVSSLLVNYSPETSVALVSKVSQPDERRYEGTLATILNDVDVSDWKLTTIMLVGPVLNAETGTSSRLYAKDYAHKFRRAKV